MATREELKQVFANGQMATGEKFANLIDSMKVVQPPVVDPQALGTSLTFIDSITQDADGVITVTKKRMSPTVGSFRFVANDATAEAAFTAVGAKYSGAISGVSPSADTLGVILLMNDDDTTPTKTMMITTEEVTPATNPATYQFVYVGDLDSALPTDVINAIAEVNVGSQATLALAIAAVPDALKKAGLTVTYYDTTASKWVAKQYIGTTTEGWSTESNWENAGVTFATGEKVGDVSIDNEPTAGSNNLVKSGGVYEDVMKLRKETSIAKLTQKDADDVQDKYINSAGTIGNATTVKCYFYDNSQGNIINVKATLASAANNQKFVGFYSSLEPSSSTFMSGVDSVISDSYLVDVPVPVGCKLIVVANNHTIITEPSIEVTWKSDAIKNIESIESDIASINDSIATNNDTIDSIEDEINGETVFNHAVVSSGGSMTFNPITLSQNGDSLEISVKFSSDLTSNQGFAFTRYNGNIAISLKSTSIGIKNSSNQWVTGYNGGSGQKALTGKTVNNGTSIKLVYESNRLNLYIGGELFDSSDVQPEIKIDTLCGVHSETNYWVGEIYKFEWTHNGITKNFVDFEEFSKNSGVALVYAQADGIAERVTRNEENIDILNARVTAIEDEIPTVQDLKNSLSFANGYYNPVSGKFTQQNSGSSRISTTNYIDGGFSLIPKDSNWRVFRLVGYDENFTTVFVSVNDAYGYGDTVQANIDSCKYYRLTMELSSGSAYPLSDCISSMLPIDSVVEQVEEDVNSLNKITRKELKDTLIMVQGYYHQGNGSWTPQSEGANISCSNYINGGVIIFPLNNEWKVNSVVGYDSDKRIISVLSGVNLGRGEVVKVTGAYYYRFTMRNENSNVTPSDECVASVLSETPGDGIDRIDYRLDQNVDGVDCQQLDFKFDLSLISTNYDTTTYPADVNAVYALWESLRTTHADYITKSSAADDYEETPSYLPAPIYLYKFLPSKNRIDKSRHIKVLLYAGEHPNEKPSITTPYEVMRAITEDWATSKDLELLRSMVDIYVIPCLSPWGYNNNSRINSNGVNLNRNAATINWQSGEIGANYGGPAAASEYETQVLQYYINTIQPDITIDVHAGGTNSHKVICTVDAFINDLKYNVQPDVDLVTTITKTGSNRFIIDDSVNFPQDLNVNLADANIQIESAMMEVTAVDSYHGESGNYALEHGVRLPVLIELCGDCSWINGSYSASNHRWDANMARGNSRYLMNVLMRLVKYMSEKLTHKR